MVSRQCPSSRRFWWIFSSVFGLALAVLVLLANPSAQDTQATDEGSAHVAAEELRQAEPPTNKFPNIIGAHEIAKQTSLSGQAHQDSANVHG